MKKIIAGNWKMNKEANEVEAYCKEINNANIPEDVEVYIYVPSIFAKDARNLITNDKIHVGVQNIHQEISGAYTGEISAPMVKSAGISDTLVGHSERRIYFNESDKIINKKIEQALQNGIKPMLCIGETLEERQGGIMKSVILTQLEGALSQISPEDMQKIDIAYEPVWAIGTGETATKEQAQEACLEIRKVIEKLYGEEIAKNTNILYGGSVNLSNIAELLDQADINGVLVGGASLEANNFAQMF